MALPAPEVSPPAILWSNAAPQSGYLIVNGRTQSQTPIVGVQSRTQIDVAIYDMDTYRNEMSAARIGRPWQIITEVDQVSPGGSGVVIGPSPAGVVVDELDPPVVIAQTQDTVVAKDDPYNATPPFSTPKIRSLYLFWSGASGTGDILAECWADEYTEFAIVPSQQIF